MNVGVNGYVLVVGRVLLAAIFLYSAYGKITGFEGTAQFMGMYGMPIPEVFLVGTIILEVVAGIGLIVGWLGRWNALALALFLVAATLIFHNAFADPEQWRDFMKNFAIIGGLLMVTGLGAGSPSVDEWLSRRDTEPTEEITARAA